MRPIADTGFDAKTTAANAAWRARALEKPNSAANLDGKSQDGFQQQPHGKSGNSEMASLHYETHAHVPFRYAPRLTAAFTAQLLGQILPDHERPSARSYGGEQPILPRCLDARL